MEYIFTLKYQLVDQDGEPDTLIELLGAVGCDDALVGVGQPGRLAMEFSRESGSAEKAIRSALADVKKAIPSARLIEVSPDFVGLTDVADIVGISRQAMRKLMLAHRAAFPMPIHEGSASIWHLAEVLDWFKARGGYQLDDRVLGVARAALEVNIAKEANRHPVRDHRDMELLTE